ncbi:MAG TPA: hypothetical protein VG125_31760 [Pirellulales bacterium]|jgi:hypothetical protein|nr:hypothetical protein [Pirellulales bacterium]
MSRQRTANLVKGFAWLSLAAAAMPSFATLDGPAGATTKLTVGLPWSPWLVYRESWVNPETAAAPALSCETTVEPRSESIVALVAGIALLLISRLLRSHGSPGSRIQGSAFALRTSAARR